MKLLFLILLLLSFSGYSQKIIREEKTDTITTCGQKFLLKRIHKWLHSNEKSIEVSDLIVLKPGKNKNDTVLALETLSDAELRKYINESEDKNYSELVYYQRISENILEIINAKSHYFEGAAHGEHWYDNTFFDLHSRTYFSLKDILEEDAFPVINAFVLNELKVGFTETGESYKLPPKRYTFDRENLVITCHYLDAESPVHVSYAQQSIEVYMPITLLKSFLKPESPVYKMINNRECR